MTEKHTFGPWMVAGDGFAVFGPDHLIAKCNPIEDEPTDAEWDEAEANAHLIAAAPDLLLALEELAGLTVIDHTPESLIGRALASADAAIVKARGRNGVAA